MQVSSMYSNSYNEIYKQAQAANAAKTEEVKETESKEQSVFDKLKETFSNVNFVTGADPFGGKNPRQIARNTVYLDDDALRKIESSPRYAARVFAEIEASMDIYSKGYSYTEGDMKVTLAPGPTNLSFYGKEERVAGMSSSMSIQTVVSGSASSSLLTLFGETKGKAVHRSITEKSNASLKKWFDNFNVDESERKYYDFNVVWSKLQAARQGVMSE